MLVDSHCHLDYPDYAGEKLDAALDRARRAGVGAMLTIGTELSRFPGARLPNATNISGARSASIRTRRGRRG